jgi:cobyrinic acid a,c-diamide synthase
VQPFKVGPDYIDPMFHTSITGNASRNLDAYMLSAEVLKHLYANASVGKDISIIEGVMGLYDGIGGTSSDASTAYLARILDIPIVLVVNAEGISMSIIPMIKGFVDFDKNIKIRGVIFNNLKSYIKYDDYYQPYLQFSPQIIMNKFKQFLD